MTATFRLKPFCCDRCGYLADFLVPIIRQIGEQEPHTEYWCWSCVSGDDA